MFDGWESGMDALDRAIDSLDGQGLSGLPGAVLGADLVELVRVAARLDAQLLRRVAEFDRRGECGVDGAASTQAWLRWRCRIGARDAAQRVAVARALDRALPDVAAALAAGAIGYRHAAVAARAVRDLPPAQLPAAEAILLDAARELDAGRLTVVGRRLGYHLDPDGTLADAQARHGGRWLTLSPTFAGMVAVTGMLDPDAGAAVITAVEALRAADRTPEDTRSAGQARADALTALATQALDGGRLPDRNGERPHLTVTVDLPTLQQHPGVTAGSGADLDWVGPIPADTARRIACDAAVARILTAAPSIILDAGRATRAVSPGLRRALAVRDHGCIHPTCDRPPPWTDAHHITHWADGGPTNLDNLALVCRHHHRQIHEGRATITRTPDGRYTMRRPP
jgi:hypothetical protein